MALQTVPRQRDPITLLVTGELPLYLAESTLYRVDPGDYDVNHADGPPYPFTHWFDGLSTLHAFHIEASSNSVSYRSRSLTDSIQRIIQSTFPARQQHRRHLRTLGTFRLPPTKDYARTTVALSASVRAPTKGCSWSIVTSSASK